MRDPIQGALRDHGMTTVQRSDPHSEGKVVMILVGGEHEVFAGHGAHADNTGVDEILGRTDELLDGFRRPIDGEYVPTWGDTTCDLAAAAPGPQPISMDAHAWPKRTSINDRSKAWRQRRHKQHRRASSHHQAVARAGDQGYPRHLVSPCVLGHHSVLATPSRSPTPERSREIPCTWLRRGSARVSRPGSRTTAAGASKPLAHEPHRLADDT